MALLQVPRPVEVAGFATLNINSQMLIGLVQERESLWNSKHRDWCNRILRNKLWNQVTKRIAPEMWAQKEHRTLLSEYFGFNNPILVRAANQSE